ncbi:MAG TPA: 2-C-methyl-D-erythritol 4-phosphate cytidylyltransferase [Gemmatimonadaceae bacterium]
MSAAEATHSPPSPPSRDVGVVIVAAGASTRAGGGELKQLRWVAGKPMLLHSLQTFMARADVVSVVCVLPRQYAGDPPPWVFQCDVDRLMIAPGGETRTQSVANGLDDLPDEASIVLIHDAARPLVDNDTIDRVVHHVRSGEPAIAALPVTDTLKEVDASHRIVRTLDRSLVWRAQTPQGFPRDVIVRAHREAVAARISASDDAALCERLGIRVAVVRGSERALKVTEEEDFARVEAMARSPE